MNEIVLNVILRKQQVFCIDPLWQVVGQEEKQ